MVLQKKPPFEIRIRVLSAVDFAPGNSIRSRIRAVANRSFIDEQTGCEYQFTWRTISTWLYRFKKNGMATLDNKTRADKNTYRKVQLNELAEAINEILPSMSMNKTGVIPKSTLYRTLLSRNFFQRSQLSQTSFYRMIRDNNLLDLNTTKKLRLSFAYRDVGKGREQDAEALPCNLPMSCGRLIRCMAPPLNKRMVSGKRPS